jgi:pimeloyl-ACP methyl ester carboxylesterase
LQLPRYRVAHFTSAGHAAFLETPEAFVAVLDDFLGHELAVLRAP